MALIDKSFSGLITFTRSTGGGRFNAQGQYEWLGPDEPRIDYDPLTGECLGLLVEEQRTNLLARSNDAAAWSGLEKEANVAIAPDGTMTAAKISAPGRNQYRYVTFTAQQQVFYRYLKAGEASTAYLRAYHSGQTIYSGAEFNLATGQVVGTPIHATASIAPVGGGWYRCSITFTPTATSGGYVYTYVGSLYSGVEDGQGIYAWGAQLEIGAFPTSYIPTEGAQVTRAADTATVEDIAPWYNPEQGTLFVEAIAAPVLTGSTMFSLDSGSVSNQMWTALNRGIPGAYIYTAGAMQAQITGKTVAPGALTRHGVSLQPGSFVFAADGQIVGNRTSFIMPLVSRLNLGKRWNSSDSINGYIRSIYYYPRKLPDSELQEITA